MPHGALVGKGAAGEHHLLYLLSFNGGEVGLYLFHSLGTQFDVEYFQLSDEGLVFCKEER